MWDTMKIQDITVICEAEEPKADTSARAKLNHSLTSRSSGAHKDKAKTIPRKQKHKGTKFDESPLVVHGKKSLQDMVSTVFDKWNAEAHSVDEIKELLKVMGMTLSVDKDRAVIDTINKYKGDL